ncbi:glucosamine inositolphosphorylceramide transferase family protein [Vallitalea okinawensis]|uniref:glucosamine inositolphosphorylceramide transferase family protein n=1 Tax=Vallitalea okinawensis TaxID=2078660 RepID=UPI000CFC352C|nr:hypothetical protein [Vallitalea okinawensis]
MSKLSVGIIVDNTSQSNTVWDLYNRSLKSDKYVIKTLIVQSKKKEKRIKSHYNFIKKKGILRYIGRLTFKVIIQCEKMLFLKRIKKTKYFDSYFLNEFDIKKLHVNPIISKSGLVYRYSEEDLEKIKRENLDILVRAGGGILRGEILTITKYGILSFHHADNDINRGAPSGFWQVYHRLDKTGFIIQILKDELDGGEVLFKGFIRTAPIFLQNKANLYSKANYFMHKILNEISTSESIPPSLKKIPYAYTLFTQPKIREQLMYIFKTINYLSKGFFTNTILNHKMRWGVAYIFSNNWRSSVLWKSKIIKNPPKRYLAYPFVINHNNLNICYVEDYNFITKTSKISAIELKKDGYKFLGTALQESFNLSYPFLFKSLDEIYMCPASHQINDIRIYKCDDFPLKWSLHKILIKDIDTMNTSIFELDGKWWMLTNVDSTNSGDYNSELHIFYSDSFESDKWIPHPKNPIIFDSTRSKNSGLIIDNEGIFRIFQVQSFYNESRSMGIAQILKINNEEYVEKVYAEIPPKFLPKIKGTHTFSYDNSGLVSLDFVKSENIRK